MASNQQKNKPNPDLLNFLRNSDVFRVHTGNVNTWSDLKLRTFENMSEEMAECLRLQLSDWNPLQDELSTGGSVDFRLCTNKRCDAPDIKAYERENLKITVKVFLSDPPEAQDVKKCVQAFIKECSTNFIDQIIVALAPLDPAKCIQPTLSAQMLKIWPDLEPLVVEDHLCAALGTSDLDADDLERVYEGAKRVKLLVNHYNIAACCAVPPELKEYAKRKDIVLLTHNDPHPFLTTKQVQDLFCENLKIPTDLSNKWTAKWAGRLTIIDKWRSVILSKSYIVHFEKKK